MGVGCVQQPREPRQRRRAFAALREGDVGRWAGVLTRSVDAQRALHPSLVGPRHQAAIDVAHRLGCSGWKVNGAGGAGGSLTLVLGDHDTSASRQEVVDALWAVDPAWTVLDLEPSAGLTITDRR